MIHEVNLLLSLNVLFQDLRIHRLFLADGKVQLLLRRFGLAETHRVRLLVEVLVGEEWVLIRWLFLALLLDVRLLEEELLHITHHLFRIVHFFKENLNRSRGVTPVYIVLFCFIFLSLDNQLFRCHLVVIIDGGLPKRIVVTFRAHLVQSGSLRTQLAILFGRLPRQALQVVHCLRALPPHSFRL